MLNILVIVIASLALAAGLTAFTTVSVRSEDNKGLIAGSFIVSFIIVAGALSWARLPIELTTMVGGVGVLMTALFIILLKAGRHLEEKGHWSR
jgi:hypothetical protein